MIDTCNSTSRRSGTLARSSPAPVFSLRLRTDRAINSDRTHHRVHVKWPAVPYKAESVPRDPDLTKHGSVGIRKTIQNRKSMMIKLKIPTSR